MGSKFYLDKGYYIVKKKGIVELFSLSFTFLFTFISDIKKLFFYKTDLLYFINKNKYAATSNPYKRIYINPIEIEYENTNIPYDCLGRIVDGSWDDLKQQKPISKMSTYRGLVERFSEQKSWNETEYVSNADKIITLKGSHRGYNDIQSFIKFRCDYLDKLYYKIYSKGYSPNIDSDHQIKDICKKDGGVKKNIEPLVVISRHGEIYLRDGLHRLTIAKILDIKSIPVNVVARHKEWQKMRDRIYKKPISELTIEEKQYLNHPDMQDIS